MNKKLSKVILLFSILTLIVSCKNHINETKIDLSSKRLTKIPESVFENKNLIELELGAKEVVFYPPLSALSEGDKDRNQILELPERISELILLRKLILNSNKLTELPNSITKLENLEVLDLALNKDLNILAEIPKLNKLPKLKILKITDTNFNKSDLEIIKEKLNKDITLVYTIDDYFESYGK